MSAVEDSVQIENVVASSGIGQELDLATLAGDLAGTKYDPENFPGLVYRLQNPKAAALIFRSGNIVCTGATSLENVRTALERVFAELREIGVDVKESPSVEIQNIVSSGDLGAMLNLNAIAIGLGLEAVEYEPEQFPGLVYRLDEPDVVALLFGSGKIVITGATQPKAATQGIGVIQTRLHEVGLLED